MTAALFDALGPDPVRGNGFGLTAELANLNPSLKGAKQREKWDAKGQKELGQMILEVFAA